MLLSTHTSLTKQWASGLASKDGCALVYSRRMELTTNNRAGTREHNDQTARKPSHNKDISRSSNSDHSPAIYKHLSRVSNSIFATLLINIEPSPLSRLPALCSFPFLSASYYAITPSQ